MGARGSTDAQSRRRRWWRAVVPGVLAVALTGSLVPGLSPASAGDGVVVDQDPFLCTTEMSGLGQPIVDNQDRRGTPVYPLTEAGAPDRTAAPLGWSERCQAESRTTYHYRTTGGGLAAVPDGATELPGDVAWIPTAQLIGAADMGLDGAEAIPHVLRLQRGTLPGQRYMYSIAMLVPWAEVVGEVESSHAHWNGRLVFSFDGGVGIGHSQGSLPSRSGTLVEAMQLGHAILYSSGTATSIHYNLLRGGLTAVEAKARFIAEHGEPRYTIGIGGSGGGIQQYIYGQNQPSVLDAAMPLYSYPDMTTQTIHTGDCELLEHYMDVTDAANPRWADWDQRKVVQGLNSIQGFTSAWQQRTGAAGSSECIEGWRGLTPLAMNPKFGFASGMDAVLEAYLPELLTKIGAGQAPVPDDFPDVGRYLRVAEDPSTWVEWTHWDDVREVYGTDPATGLARVPWDNVGVQYGLRSVGDGTLTPEEFLDLNARVGSWTDPQHAAPESCGLIGAMLGNELAALAGLIGLCEGAQIDRHSARQMLLGSGDGSPAPRRTGDVEAARGAYVHGLFFDGRLGRDIPVIDARHYLEHRLDMHNVHQSFSARERIARAQGHHDNHLIWFLDARPGIDDAATTTLFHDGFRLVDEWMANIAANPGAGASATRPAQAVDTCWATDGSLIAAGADVWDGAVELIEGGQGAWAGQAPTEVDGTPVGACAQHFPLHSTSRIVAGGPVTGDVYICHRMPVQTAVHEGLYGGWAPSPADVARLEEIHPTGVCDYDLPDSARPDVTVADPPAASSFAGGLAVTGAAPGAEVEVRQGGEVVLTGTAGAGAGAAAGASGAAAAEVGGVWLGPLPEGDYVLAQRVDGQRSRLSAPVTVVAAEPEPEPGPGPQPEPEPEPEPEQPPAGPPPGEAPPTTAPPTVAGAGQARDTASGRLPATGSELLPLLLAGLGALTAGQASRQLGRRRARAAARHLRR